MDEILKRSKDTVQKDHVDVRRRRLGLRHRLRRSGPRVRHGRGRQRPAWWIPRCTPTPAASPPRPRLWARWPSSQASGKKTKKKDLGMLMMTYDNVYVAQWLHGRQPRLSSSRPSRRPRPTRGPPSSSATHPASTTASRRAWASVQQEMKDAVDSGYWNLYRYSPETHKTFTLDSKEPSMAAVRLHEGRGALLLPGAELPGERQGPVCRGGGGRQGQIRVLQAPGTGSISGNFLSHHKRRHSALNRTPSGGQ